jgi:hypothetical protein
MVNRAMPVCAEYKALRKFCLVAGRSFPLLSCKNAAALFACSAHSWYIRVHIAPQCLLHG